MDVREKLIELFYDNNVICDQKIEGACRRCDGHYCTRRNGTGVDFG